MIKKYMILIIITSLFLFINNVKAISCSTEEKIKLNTEVVNIKANYEIKERILNPDEYIMPANIVGTEEKNYQPKKDYIQINILNLSDNVYIDVSNDYERGSQKYYYTDFSNNRFEINWYDISEIVTYTVKIYSSENTSCPNNLLKTLYVKLPRYNDYSKLNFCSNLDDYYLCQQYVNYDEVEFSDFVSKVKSEIKKREKVNEKTSWLKKILNFIDKHRILFIVLGGVLVVTIAGVAYVILKRRNGW